MSKSAIYKRQISRAGTISWQLAQTFWVGGLWLLRFVMLPALEKIGLAPLLIEDVADGLSPLMVGFALFCAGLQALVLAQAEGLGSLWRDLRGQLLLTVLTMGLLFLVVRAWLPDAQRWLTFNYLVLAFCGVLLVLQPGPDESRRP